MKPLHDIPTNLRLWSVQAGMAGGALTAALGTLSSYFTANHINLDVPAWCYVVSGILTAAGVFGARMFPQDSVTGAK